MSDLELKGRVALVTGANHGVGAATAIALAREGADIFLTYLRIFPSVGKARTAKELGPAKEPGPRLYYSQILPQDAKTVIGTIQALGRRVVSWEADLSDWKKIPRLMDKAEKNLGKVDILVNNADHYGADTFLPASKIPARGLLGGLLRGEGTDQELGAIPLRTISARSHDEHFAVNSRAVALLMAEFARRVIDRKSGWGRVINISTDGARGHAWSVSYGASKWAAESYSRAAAAELGPFGITVNVVSPGAIQTGWLPPGAARAVAKTYPLRRIGTPEDIASAVVFLTSSRADWITGQVLYVGGGNRM